MKFESPLLTGRLLRRYQRFFAEVRLDSGETVVTHCANTGSMKTCLEIGGRVWLTRSGNPKRKLATTWQLSEVNGELIFVHPSRANDVVVEAVKGHQVPELQGYDVLRREVRFGERSRIDFVLHGDHACYVEVKNVTLSLGQERCAFPDAVTMRGTRHLNELRICRSNGHRAVMFFFVARQGARSFEPAREIDPDYADALRRAVDAGVEAIAYGCSIRLAPVPEVVLGRRLRVHL